MQLYRRVEHLFKNRIFLNVSPTDRPLFGTFIGLFGLFKHVVGTGATVKFFCKKAIRRGTELSGNFYSSRKKIPDRKFPFVSVF